MFSPSCTIPATAQPNAGALRVEWPRIWLLGWPDSEAEGSGATLAESAARGAPVCRFTRSRNARPPCHPNAPTSRDHGHRRSIHHRRGQHGGRRFRRHSWLGALRSTRRYDVWPGPIRRACRHAARNVLPNLMPCQPLATRLSISISMARPPGATTPPPSGPTGSAATKCSRSGSPIGNVKSSGGGFKPEKSNNSRIRHDESVRYCCLWTPPNKKRLM